MMAWIWNQNSGDSAASILSREALTSQDTWRGQRLGNRMLTVTIVWLSFKVCHSRPEPTLDSFIALRQDVFLQDSFQIFWVQGERVTLTSELISVGKTQSLKCWSKTVWLRRWLQELRCLPASSKPEDQSAGPRNLCKRRVGLSASWNSSLGRRKPEPWIKLTDRTRCIFKPWVWLTDPALK